MWLQAHVSQVAMKAVVRALAQHPTDADIQAKGLVVLGVLGQVTPLSAPALCSCCSCSCSCCCCSCYCCCCCCSCMHTPRH